MWPVVIKKKTKKRKEMKWKSIILWQEEEEEATSRHIFAATAAKNRAIYQFHNSKIWTEMRSEHNMEEYNETPSSMQSHTQNELTTWESLMVTDLLNYNNYKERKLNATHFVETCSTADIDSDLLIKQLVDSLERNVFDPSLILDRNLLIVGNNWKGSSWSISIVLVVLGR